MAKLRSSGFVLSTSAHAAVVLWAAVSFAARPLDKPPTESIFVETMSMSEFTKLTAGTKTAPHKEKPKPLVEKKAEPKPVENQQAPVSEKPEIVTASAPPQAAPPPQVTPPPPKPAPPEPKEVKTPPPKPAPPEPKKEPVKQPDAEALKKAEQKEVKKDPPKPKQEAKPLPPRRPAPKKEVAEKKQETPPSKFNADQIAELLDKRQPRRVAAAGDEINPTPTLGAPRGTAQQLSQNEIDALVSRLRQCWQTLGGDLREESLKIPITLRFKPDGTLASQPQIDMPLRTQRERAMAEGVVRAVVGCQPYTMLPRAKYDEWKELPFNFDPRVL